MGKVREFLTEEQKTDGHRRWKEDGEEKRGWLLTSRAALTGVREVMEPPFEGEYSRDWCRHSFSGWRNDTTFPGEFLKIKIKKFLTFIFYCIFFCLVPSHPQYPHYCPCPRVLSPFFEIWNIFDPTLQISNGGSRSNCGPRSLAKSFFHHSTEGLCSG